MTNETRLREIQALEQTAHACTVQKRTSENELAEVGSALKELGDEAYHIIGNIMVKTSPERIRGELEQQKAQIEERISRLEAQEKQIHQQMRSLQEKILGDENVQV